MNNTQLRELLARSEDPKLDFKLKWYSGDNKLDDKGWGEFLKDIIALANGNTGYIGKPAYLIIGAADEDPPPNKPRETLHIPSVGMLAQLQKLRDDTLRKLHSTCSPPLPDMKFEFVSIHFQQKHYIAIPGSKVYTPSNSKATTNRREAIR